MNEKKQCIEELLSRGESVQVAPEGYSMYPMFVPGRDQAILKRADTKRLKKGDVILYRRPGSILVLHRICKYTPEGFFMVGDNQIEIEGPLAKEQIIGVLTGFVRKGRAISVQNPVYVICAKLWLFLRPIRRPLQLTAAFIKRVTGKLKRIFRKNAK